MGGEFAGKHASVRHVLHMSANATGSSPTELRKPGRGAARPVTLTTSTSCGREGREGMAHSSTHLAAANRRAVRSSQLLLPGAPAAVPED